MKKGSFNPDIIPYDPALRNAIIDVWEASVRATHQFLAHDDIAFYKTIIESIALSSLELHCLRHDGHLAGFIAVAGPKIEMLFLDPSYRGQGHGARLLHFATSNLNATLVDVNEQNTQALRFYEKNGFFTFSRSETDGTGKPYPILHMQLSNA